MKNKTLKILIGTGAVLALVSCGGGGGSSSGSSGDTTTNKTVNNEDKTETKVEPKTETKTETPKLKNVLNGDEVELSEEGKALTIKTANADNITFEGDSFTINGVTYAAWDLQNRVVGKYWGQNSNNAGYLAFTGKAGPTVAYQTPNHVPTTDEVFDTGYQTTEIRSPIAEGQKSFTGIYYQYSYSNPNGTWKSAKNNDGVITYDPSKSGWSARFDGEGVKLDGQISGNNVVSGTATVNGIKGEFNGYDAVYVGDTPKNEYGIGFGEKTHRTNGAFAGSNGTQSFGGVWGKTETEHDVK